MANTGLAVNQAQLDAAVIAAAASASVTAHLNVAVGLEDHGAVASSAKLNYPDGSTISDVGSVTLAGHTFPKF